jgi:large subunit ribosomal protein L25
MERILLDVLPRQKTGKGIARALRREGIIPAVLYRKGNSISLQLDGREISRLISRTAGEKVIVDLKFPNEVRQAIIKDYQKDPVYGELLHVDFQEILATETVKVAVHLAIKGEPIGVKRDKGVLQYGIRDIEIECLPDRIPGHVDVDVSNLGLGQSIHVRDIKLGEGIKILTDPNDVVASVTAVKEEIAAPVAAEIAEPEVIKKGKKIEEE